MKSVKYLEDFNTFSAIQDLVARLPSYCSTKRLKSARDIEDMNGRYDFNELVDVAIQARRNSNWHKTGRKAKSCKSRCSMSQ